MTIIAGEDKVEGLSQSPQEQDIARLKAAFPQCFAEGKLDIDRLLNLCGEYIDNDFEKFKFEWKGKIASLKLAQKPSLATLRPKIDESVDFDNTHNVYIKGDNLEVLKLIQRAYFQQVKMIYIDPPYNTGNDFVYEDDFKDPLARYKEVTRQTTKSNPETMGRFHTAWLNMMYPRLRLAQSLLRDDGVIFISIDDHEVHNLRKVCDEVFGEENFVAQLVWEKVHTRKNSAKYFSVSHEYVICYAKYKENFKRNLLPRQDTSAYKNPDNHPKGPWKADPITAHKPYAADYTITKPNGVVLKRPQGAYWRFSEKVLKEKIANDEIIWGEGEAYPMIKRFLSEAQDGLVPTTFFGKEIDADFDEEFAGIFKREFAGDTAYSKREIDQLMHIQGLFEYIKPTKLIKLLMQIGTNKDDLILDFFSGSATTAHAVMAQNAADGGNRKFIMVQLPELCSEKSEAYKAGYKTICDIGCERIRRAGKQIKQQHENDLLTREVPLDTGFRVLELDSSNFPIWDDSPIDPDAPDALAQLLLRMDEKLKGVNPERSHQDIIFEIMLKYGWPLDLKIYPLQINGKNFYYLGESEGDVLVIIAIDPPFEPEDAEEMVKHLPVRVIALEGAFKDSDDLANCCYILRDNDVRFDRI